jgi:hypothetical protein
MRERFGGVETPLKSPHATKRPEMTLQTPRQQQIMSLARQMGQVQVEDLSARFDVTPQTIRKDLIATQGFSPAPMAAPC